MCRPLLSFFLLGISLTPLSLFCLSDYKYRTLPRTKADRSDLLFRGRVAWRLVRAISGEGQIVQAEVACLSSTKVGKKIDGKEILNIIFLPNIFLPWLC